MTIDPRVEEIARAMARATCGYEGHPPSLGLPHQLGSANTGMHFSGDPEWQRYLGEAKRFVAAHDIAKNWPA